MLVIIKQQHIFCLKKSNCKGINIECEYNTLNLTNLCKLQNIASIEMNSSKPYQRQIQSEEFLLFFPKN